MRTTSRSNAVRTAVAAAFAFMALAFGTMFVNPTVAHAQGGTTSTKSPVVPASGASQQAVPAAPMTAAPAQPAPVTAQMTQTMPVAPPTMFQPNPNASVTSTKPMSHPCTAAKPVTGAMAYFFNEAFEWLAAGKHEIYMVPDTNVPPADTTAVAQWAMDNNSMFISVFPMPDLTAMSDDERDVWNATPLGGVKPGGYNVVVDGVLTRWVSVMPGTNVKELTHMYVPGNNQQLVCMALGVAQPATPSQRAGRAPATGRISQIAAHFNPSASVDRLKMVAQAVEDEVPDRPSGILTLFAAFFGVCWLVSRHRGN